MNMKQLLMEMHRIDEADDWASPSSMGLQSMSTPPAQSSSAMSQAAYDVDKTPAPLSNEDQVKKNNLTKKLYDLLTALTKAKTPQQAESYNSGIAKAIMESFKVYEAGMSNTGQIEQINAQIDDVMQQLSQYKNDPDVIKAFQQVDKIRKADYSQAKPYSGGFSPEKFKRFQELLNKQSGKAPEANPSAPKPPSAQKPQAPSKPKPDSLKHDFRNELDAEETI